MVEKKDKRGCAPLKIVNYPTSPVLSISRLTWKKKSFLLKLLLTWACIIARLIAADTYGSANDNIYIELHFILYR